jgi:CRISPR-associated exonuclease Cas4
MITASHIVYYHLCHRKLWMHDRGLRQEDNSQAVGEGKLISEQTYARRAERWRELDLGFVKIDFFDVRNKIVREVKKSPKLEKAHIAQLQYYLYTLERAGITDLRGLLEYPLQRKTRDVLLDDLTRAEIRDWESAIEKIVAQDVCPELKKKPYCKECAYRDFCFI